MNQQLKYGMIYQISFPNQKIYIGRWCNNYDSLLNRYFVKEHKIGKRPVNLAIRKYGVENININILEEFYDIDNDFLNLREEYYIKFKKSLILENGYNISTGGGSYDNFTNNPNKEKIREKIKIRMGISHPRKGIKLTDETKKKIGNKAKERLKNKENHPMYGKHFSELSKKKMSYTQKGKLLSENSKRWVGFINKEKLINCVKNDFSYKDMMKEFNQSQRVITRSLIHHFGTKEKPVIKLMILIDKTDLLNDISINSARNLYKKYNTNQRTFRKILLSYFNTDSLVIIRETFLIK
jgi:group I intron endonuclease